ncbi:MAG TPA: hypothetical protein V6D08_00670 [Candidatus Obscuribacterales bacterium]
MMKARYVVNPLLKGATGVETIQTEMLLLPTIAGTELGGFCGVVDQSLGGAISRKLKSPRVDFNGEVGEILHIKPRKGPAKNIDILGLGDGKNPQNLCKAVRAAVEDALDRDVNHVSIPYTAQNLTGINLKGQANIVHEVVEAVLADEKYADLEGEFLVELICSPNQARFLREGLAIPVTGQGACCTFGE